MELYELTAHEAAATLRTREVSSVELTRAYLERIETVDPLLHTYLTVMHDEALAMARAADARLAVGEGGPLTGIPIALKDVLVTEGVETTAGSRMLKGYIPPYSATVAAAIALGWDTGGSIRQPAALCGVVGLKPTYGRVSRFGLIAFASSLDQIGPLAKDVTDAALLLGAIAGHDPCDSTTVDLPVPDYTAALVPDVKGLRLAVPREYFVQGMQPGMEEIVRSAIGALERMGAAVGEVSLPSTPHALATYYIIAPAEASANLARFDGIKYGFSD